MQNFTIKTTLPSLDKDLLILGRHILTTNEGMSTLFSKTMEASRTTGVDFISTVLNSGVASMYFHLNEANPSYQISHARDVLQYLAEEALQIPSDTQVVLDESGRAVALITEEDFMEPHLVERENFNEDGTENPTPRMALALPTLKPEVSAAIISYRYDKALNKSILEEAESKRPDLVFLRKEGSSDPFAVLTKKGRKALPAQLPVDISSYITSKGEWQGFFNYFSLDTEGKDLGDYIQIPVVLRSQMSVNVADHKATNLNFNHLGVAKNSSIWGWCRSLAMYLEEFLSRDPTILVTLVDQEHFTLTEDFFWVGPADQLYHKSPKGSAPCFAAQTQNILRIAKDQTLGYLQLSEVQPQSFEEVKTWSVSTTTVGTLYLRKDYTHYVSIVKSRESVFSGLLDL